MTYLIVSLILVLWYTTGVIGFVFWWTTDYDFTSEQLGMAFGCGLTGPFAWVIGWGIHGNQTIVKKRGS